MVRKKTNEEFIKEVNNLGKGYYKVISQYANSKTYVTMKHTLENGESHVYKVTPGCFLAGHKCPICYGNKKKTHQEFITKLLSIFHNEYTCLSQYINSRTKVLVQHNIDKCGYKYYVVPNKILRRQRCPKCYGTPKKDTKQFKEEVYKLVGNEYTVLGEYISTNDNILMRHNVCGYEWSPRATNFLNNNTRCPKCSGNIKNKDTDYFKNEVYKLEGDNYKVLGEYVKGNKKILMFHKKCKQEYDVTPAVFLSGSRCPKCYGTPKKDTKQFKEEVYKLVGNEYTVLGEYVSTNDNILMRHNVCEHQWSPRATNFLNNSTRCPVCYKPTSKREAALMEILNLLNKQKHGFEFIHRDTKSFQDCKYKNVLEWDFHIIIKENSLLIEVDGEQHEKPIQFGNMTLEDAVKEYELTKIRDDIKDRYAKQKGIPLIRIKYHDTNWINTILDFLVKHTFITKEEKIKLLESEELKNKKAK